MMGEALLRDERGCMAQARRAYHYWTQRLTCATAPRRLKAKDREDGQKVEIPASSAFIPPDLGGNPVRGNQEMLCFLE